MAYLAGLFQVLILEFLRSVVSQFFFLTAQRQRETTHDFFFHVEKNVICIQVERQVYSVLHYNYTTLY